VESEGSLQYSQEPPTDANPSKTNLMDYPSFLRWVIVSLGVPSGFYPSGFPTKIVYAFLISPITSPWLDTPVFAEEYTRWSFSMFVNFFV
jgi:hypothetical protein